VVGPSERKYDILWSALRLFRFCDNDDTAVGEVVSSGEKLGESRLDRPCTDEICVSTRPRIG